jgi:kinesin family protein C2/C3
MLRIEQLWFTDKNLCSNSNKIVKFQGGKSGRVVNCVLALKSYSEWKQTGGNGVWKFGGNVKPTVSAKSFVRKNSEPFSSSLSRNSSTSEKSLNVLSSDIDFNKMVGKLKLFSF